LIEKNEENHIVVSGLSSIVSTISCDRRIVIDQYTLGEGITATDSITFEDGGNVFAIGTSSGQLNLKFDYEEIPRNYQCLGSIIDIKFSYDAKYLALVADDFNVYLFSLKNETYLKSHPKKIAFEGGCPVSISFTDDNKNLLINTSRRENWVVDLKKLTWVSLTD